MPFTFEISPRSPTSISSLPPAQDWEWVADGIDDAATVHQAALLYTPAAIPSPQGTLYRQDVKIAKQGFGLFYVTVPYAPRERTKWTWDFDAGGGTFNVKVSKALVASYVPDGGAIVDHKGAINRQLDGTVDGVDIVIPSMRWNLGATFPYGVLTPAYAKKIFGIIGKVNSTQLFQFAPGEALCVAARGSDGSEAEASVGLSFVMEPNLTNIQVGGILVAKKDGHDYAWNEFVQKPSPDGQPVTVPKQVDVVRVYDRVDVAGILGIGG